MPGFVYLLTNPAMPGLVKIGMTNGEDARIRIDQLYSTGVPLPFDLVFACRVEDPAKLEDALHIAFGPNRVNPKREFFRIDPVQALVILRLMHLDDSTESVENQTSTVSEQELAAGREFKKKNNPILRFDDIGIPVGSLIYFSRGTQTAVIHTSRTVIFEEEEVYLTPLTQRLLDLKTAVQPSPYWLFEGRTLKAMYDEIYGTTSEE